MANYLDDIFVVFNTSQSVVCSFFFFFKEGSRNHRKWLLKCVLWNASWKRNAFLKKTFGEAARHNIPFVTLYNLCQYTGSEKWVWDLDLTWFNLTYANLIDHIPIYYTIEMELVLVRKNFLCALLKSHLLCTSHRSETIMKSQRGNPLRKWRHKFEKMEIHLAT